MNPWRGADRDRHELAAAWRDPATRARPGCNDAGAPSADDGSDRARRVACRPRARRPDGPATQRSRCRRHARRAGDGWRGAPVQGFVGRRCHGRDDLPPRRGGARGPEGALPGRPAHGQAFSSPTSGAESRDRTRPPRSPRSAPTCRCTAVSWRLLAPTTGRASPVGAAYVRQASDDVMRNRMLPASRRLYAAEAQRLSDHQRTGTDVEGLVGVLIAFGCMLAVLVQAQIYLAQRTHRVFNIPLVAATAVLVALSAWTVIGNDVGAQRPDALAARRLGQRADPLGGAHPGPARPGRREPCARRSRRTAVPQRF